MTALADLVRRWWWRGGGDVAVGMVEEELVVGIMGKVARVEEAMAEAGKVKVDVGWRRRRWFW